MAKYKINGDGVIDLDTNACIPDSISNRHWLEYQEWVALGNTPDPEFTQSEIDDKLLQEEITILRRDLKQAMVWQFRMIQELFRLLKLSTSITNASVDPEILAKAIQWKTKTDRLKEIDE